LQAAYYRFYDEFPRERQADRSGGHPAEFKSVDRFCREYTPISYAIEPFVRSASLYTLTAKTGAYTFLSNSDGAPLHDKIAEAGAELGLRDRHTPIPYTWGAVRENDDRTPDERA
jgi:hypothetical protein